MAFKRKEAVIEATDLNTISPEEAEKRIIAGVKKYATNEANFSSADANTPYLGHIVGMGIESSNLADITMSIERQFLTKMTTRVAAPNGAANDFILQPGELGKLRILDGQDALAATPGLSIKMLMDHGHMAKNDAYLSKVVSFAYIAAVGDGYKLADALKKMTAKTAGLSGPEKDEALANLKTMVAQAKACDEQMSDPAKLAAARQKTYANDQGAYDALQKDLEVVLEKLKGAAASNDSARVASLRAEEAEVRTRLKMSGAKLNVSREVAQQAGKRSAVEQQKVDTLRKILSEAIAAAERL